jgi:hypothetical protein
MKKLIIIPLLILSVLCNAQFTKGGGMFLKTGNVFLSGPSLVQVSSIDVFGTGGATTIASDGGTLQMLKKTLPTNAADTTVTWSGTNAVGTVSSSGLVTALTNGTVTPRATANDGSAVYGEEEITVSGQVVEMIADGGFDNASKWTYGASFTVSGSKMNYAASAIDVFGQTNANMAVAIEASHNYIFDIDVAYTAGGKVHLRLFDYSGSISYTTAAYYEPATHVHVHFTTPADIGVNGGIGIWCDDWNTMTFDNMSVVEDI